MLKFLEAISIIAKAQDIILSVDCFLKDNGIETNPVFAKIVIIQFLPVLGILLACIFWMSVCCCCGKKYPGAPIKLVTSIIILIFVALPPITTITFSIYNCIAIFNNQDSYLAIDMGVQCWVTDHNYYAKSYGIPIIVIWVIGCPLLAFILMFRQRKVLGSAENLRRYGFLYTGLNHRAFYWEILLHFRKVLMISINVFFTTFKPLYRVINRVPLILLGSYWFHAYDCIH
jgi:hypothetical protein